MWHLLLLLLFVVVHVRAGTDECWWTGCQKNDWLVQGCEQYNRVEIAIRDCYNGHEFQCCPSSGSYTIHKWDSSSDTCWWTGCQKNFWAVRGCEQYNMVQRSLRYCENGEEYFCCPASGSGRNSVSAGSGASGYSTETCWWTGCQRSDWAVRGCEQYNRVKINIRNCANGNEYYCCPIAGGFIGSNSIQLSPWNNPGIGYSGTGDSSIGFGIPSGGSYSNGKGNGYSGGSGTSSGGYASDNSNVGGIPTSGGSGNSPAVGYAPQYSGGSSSPSSEGYSEGSGTTSISQHVPNYSNSGGISPPGRYSGGSGTSSGGYSPSYSNGGGIPSSNGSGSSSSVGYAPKHSEIGGNPLISYSGGSAKPSEGYRPSYSNGADNPSSDGSGSSSAVGYSPSYYGRGGGSSSVGGGFGGSGTSSVGGYAPYYSGNDNNPSSSGGFSGSGPSSFGVYGPSYSNGVSSSDGSGTQPAGGNDYCWWTGCQRDDWKVKGCEQYNMIQVNNQYCSMGQLYYCCPRNGGTNTQTVVPDSGENCWWTGCQKNDWAVRGCANYNRVQSNTRLCDNGQEYYCCPQTQGNNLIPVESCWWTGCQKNDWKVRGCDNYNRTQVNVRTCDNGQEYYCCTKTSSTNPQTVVPDSRDSCWWTGCQKNNWKVRGCDNYNRVQKHFRHCDNGDEYFCCP